MLTLFCPWRTGIDLKSASITWKEAFDSYSFTQRQRELMDNFNIKYACYNARDDFAAWRSSNQQGDGGNEQEADDDDQDERGNCVGTMSSTNEDDQLDEQMEDGPLNKALSDDNDTSLKALKSAGWDYMDYDANATLQLPTIPSQHRDSAAWDAFLKKESQRIWKSKFASLDICSRTGSSLEDVTRASSVNKIRNDAWVVPASYLSSSYADCGGETGVLIKDVADSFTLNEEQNRAFRIVANHAATPHAEQLLMHLGGMGGTGKSCVIHSLVKYFNARKEPYRFVLLGPTGTSAALIGGSTYHSFLGLGRTQKNRNGHDKLLEDLMERLRGVDYILLDEMSMVSCEHLAIISARLAAATQRPEAFGGLNVILAGDFAQLPPVGGKPLYSRKVSTLRSARAGVGHETEALGKHFWQQFTCVVILKKNMRQLGQSPDERAFQRALENLRFKACTKDDYNLLTSRVAEINPSLSLNADPWKNVSIITARNCDKDLFNNVHAERFANEIGQKLHLFYSDDKIVDYSKKKGGRATKEHKPLNRFEQEGLWRQPADTSDQIPGCLKVCLGMPVMIRFNVSTELCITRGQDARVVGWTSRPIKGFVNRNKLEVLFVELINPPKPVKVDKLPDNVVPITLRSQTLDARLPSDRTLHINRSQAPVLPNFGMTDYASQGKGRAINVVDIARSLTFQGVYTALSRGLSLEGTLILRKFEFHQISGPLDGALRQEFRDLNYLDLITKMWFEGNLPSHIIGETRQDTISNYRLWRSLDEEQDWHPVLQGEDEHPVFEGVKRKSANQDESTSLVIGKKMGTVLSQVPVRACDTNTLSTEAPARKRRKLESSITPISTIQNAPAFPWFNADNPRFRFAGPRWDSTNWSCAFDVWTFLIASILQENRALMTSWSRLSPAMNELMCALERVDELTRCRDSLRNHLMRANPERYRHGEVGTDIISLTYDMLDIQVPPHASKVSCRSCGFVKTMTLGFFPLRRYNTVSNVSSIADETGRRTACIGNCTCGGLAYVEHDINDILCFEVIRGDSLDPIVLDNTLCLGPYGNFMLKGVIYHGNYHFVSNFVSMDGSVFGYDGMLSDQGTYRGNLTDSTQPLVWGGAYKPSLAVYVKQYTSPNGEL
ncbi:hypothetical protein CVT24_000037 [Panaeolus cyanescens]|uniref:ATP-dependent DNA helicase n=1 Tax=Panaeolus cyanescens TaxID=181874 RepID=A0A409W7C6_9AGAR|nr:hypothetical protein CVT24_000037 [Panaeolus cyanescens]